MSNFRHIGLALLLAGGIVLPAAGQSALDLRSRAALREAAVLGGDSVGGAAGTFQAVELPEKSMKSMPHLLRGSNLRATVKLAPGATVGDLEAAGVEVGIVRGRIAVVTFPAADVERVAALDCITRMELPRAVRPALDRVRTLCGIDDIHAGTDLPCAYTGRDVVTGIVDQGIAPAHIAFTNPADGTPRIKQLTCITANTTTGYITTASYTAATIDRFTTDTEDSYHGTHTTGIMAGGYRGEATVATLADDGTPRVAAAPIPYYGIATGSDIAASCGDLYDDCIIYGVDGILQYAEATGQPAVINMSLGSTLGSHDGTSLLSQFLDEAGREAIIVMSAGNEGDLPIALTRTFAEGDTVVRSFIYPAVAVNGLPSLRYGQVQIYSADGSPFELQAVIYNRSRGSYIFRHGISASTEGVATYYASSSAYAEDGDVIDANLARAFDGYVGLGSMVDEESGRYYALIDYFTTDNQEKNADGNYLLGFIVTGRPGQRIDGWCDGSYTTLSGYGIEGWSDGTTDGTISDMACARNILVVGSYNSRRAGADLSGRVWTDDEELVEGRVSPFSSYGTLADGRQLPHVCAPGTNLIAPISPYYAAAHGFSADYAQASVVSGMDTCLWATGTGTSVATPVVTGAIALWLEADPTLTIDDVRGIIARTARRDSDVAEGDTVQWGAGKFDALAGLKEVLRGTSIATPRADVRPLVTRADGGAWDICLAGARSVTATLYALDGHIAARATASGDEVRLAAPAARPGIYILDINNHHHLKVTLR